MSIFRLLVIVVVLAAVIGGALHFAGVIKISSSGVEQVQGPAIPGDPFTEADTKFFANKFDEALAAYKQAVEKKPDDERVANAMYRIGKCYEETNHPEDASKAFKEFITKFPKNDNARKAEERIEYLRGQTGK
ncbi:MAG: tetratricopeptide repeat protein [Planctomycetota bacterium]|nr:tetratricopeptide repeat protein [Planctomycetota bacterium]